jgi:hypothetical protein
MHPWRTARNLRKPMNRKVLAPRTVTFSPDEFRLTTTDGIEAKTPLKEFDSVRLSKRMYLLELGIRQFYPVPVDAFQSEADHGRFVEWVKAAIPKVRGF